MITYKCIYTHIKTHLHVKKKSIYVFAYMCTIYESVLYYLIS